MLGCGLPWAKRTNGGTMNRKALVKLLVRPGEADRQPCRRLSANKFVPEAAWEALEHHEREFLRCYAAGTGVRKAVLVGRSAAVIHGMWTLPDHHAAVTLAVPGKKPPARASWPEGVEYSCMGIPPVDVETIVCATPGDVLRVTTPVRTAVDVARLHGVREGVVAMDSLLSKKSPAEQQRILGELEATIGRLAGKKGIANARQAFQWCSGWSESAYESLMRVILLERGIVAEEQMWVGRYVRPDLLWGQLAIEIDGAVKLKHNAEEVAQDQLDRENWLRKQLYDAARFKPKRILKDEEGCVREILELKAHSETLGPPKVPATRARPSKGEHWRV